MRHANLRHVRAAEHVFATIALVMTGVPVSVVQKFVRYFETPATRQVNGNKFWPTPSVAPVHTGRELARHLVSKIE